MYGKQFQQKIAIQKMELPSNVTTPNQLSTPTERVTVLINEIHDRFDIAININFIIVFRAS
jgi:hypothetical protein